MPSNLDNWNYVLKDLPSPQLFIDFSWYWVICSALQRRVFYGDYNAPTDPIFPNPLIMFVAEPGIGKSRAARIGGGQILKTFRYLDAAKVAAGIQPDKAWTNAIPFSADDTTIESLIQQLNHCTRTITIPQNVNGIIVNRPIQHASMAVLLSEEMSSLFKGGNEGVPPFFNQCYDAQDYTRMTKTKGNDIITNVCVSLLGCTTPDNVKMMMKSGVLQQGFTARAFPVYCDSPRKRSGKIVYTEEQKQVFEKLRLHIKSLLTVRGEVTFSDEAQKWFDHYIMGDEPDNMNIKAPVESARLNFDKRCDDFYGRMKVHLIKMAMALHFMDVECIIDEESKANVCSMEIEVGTIKRAVSELARIEPDMHKALASSGANPLFEFYKQVYDAIKERGGMTLVQLKLCFSENLDDLKLDAVMKHLGETGKIAVKMEGIKCKYVINQKQ